MPRHSHHAKEIEHNTVIESRRELAIRGEYDVVACSPNPRVRRFNPGRLPPSDTEGSTTGSAQSLCSSKKTVAARPLSCFSSSPSRIAHTPVREVRNR